MTERGKKPKKREKVQKEVRLFFILCNRNDTTKIDSIKIPSPLVYGIVLRH